MEDVKIDKNLVSCCWLYCGACKKYLDNLCPGCKQLNKTPFWCSIRNYGIYCMFLIYLLL